jgi:hypothetical protein
VSLPPTIEENAPSILSPPHSNTDDGKPRSPFLAQWFVPLIELIIKLCPNSSNKGLKEVLKVYANDYAMTKSILQKARTLACKEVFGEARVNAKYILALQDELELRGHFVEVILTNRQDAIHWMMLAVLAEEVRRRKATKQKYSDIINPHGARQFCIQWNRDNEDFINEHFGRVEDNWRFVRVILFAPSTSKRSAPALQNVIQADAAHMKFGKYTLYSSYGPTANAQCSPIAFAILFGNEDTDAWTRFWTFARGVHPWLDDDEKTIIRVLLRLSAPYYH